MAAHICTKEKELSEMHTILMRIDRKLNGNGHPGLLDEWQQIKGSIRTIQYLIGVMGITGIVAIAKFILIK